MKRIKNIPVFVFIVLALIGVSLFAGCKDTGSNKDSAAVTEKSRQQDVIKLKYSTPFALASTSNQYAYYFLDYIENRSDGLVKFKRYPGGVLGGVMEHLDLCSSGSVDLISTMHTEPKEKMPLHNVLPTRVPRGSKEALEFVREMEWNDPITSALLQKEWEDNNLKLMTYTAAGENGIIAKEPFKSLDDLRGKKLAGGVDLADAWIKKNITCLDIQFPDIYESLSRGVTDTAAMSLAAIVDMKWYEIAEAYMSEGNYPYSSPIIVNLDVWEGLAPEIQSIFIEAAEATREYSLESDIENTIKNKQLFKDSGLILGSLPKSDQEWLYRAYMEVWEENYKVLAKKMGKLDEASVVWEHSERLLNNLLAE